MWHTNTGNCYWWDDAEYQQKMFYSKHMNNQNLENIMSMAPLFHPSCCRDDFFCKLTHLTFCIFSQWAPTLIRCHSIIHYMRKYFKFLYCLCVMYIAGTLIGGKITLYAITLIHWYTLYGCLLVWKCVIKITPKCK